LETGELLALSAAVRDRNDRVDDAGAWTVTHELLAQLIEWTSLARVEALALGGVKVHRLPAVHRVPRPGDTEENEVVMTPREFAQLSAA
jgi:hypothetical protein